MKQQLNSCLWCSTIACVISFGSLAAEVDDQVLSKCTKEELMTFFPPEVVKSVLIKAKVAPEQASDVANELAKKDPELTKMVEDKAAKLDQDPFKDLSQRDLAIKIYRETLYEVFAKVLKAHGMKNEDQIQSLLDEMNDAKSKLFIECIRKQTSTGAAPLAPSSVATPSS